MGTFVADASGRVSVVVRIPANATAGNHHVILRGTDPSGALREVSVPITVVPRSLARTGQELVVVAQWALLLLGLGLLISGQTMQRTSQAR
ncbi:MAG: hypothetical protein Q8K58_00940 [Acidimicrobiales bacterium]|nr:hypothetical protein [Acidimicrobiales bacterium]